MFCNAFVPRLTRRAACCIVWLCYAATALTQPVAAQSLLDDADGPQVSDSGVGYIDTAVIANQFRFRWDAAVDNVQPARAEFFWPIGGNLGPGPGPDTGVHYQDYKAYMELTVIPQLSVFGEMTARFVDPDLQSNAGGLGDSNVGFKLALCQTPCSWCTFQMRTYIPSGDGSRGLGTDHVTLEPALLMMRRFGSRLTVEAELRDWISIEGTSGFDGNVLRYGMGGTLLLTDGCCGPRISGVAELVGWTVLEGQSAVSESLLRTTIRDARGDTIVNGKLGLRLGLGPCADLYTGYGIVLSKQTWYDEVYRIEYRRWF